MFFTDFCNLVDAFRHNKRHLNICIPQNLHNFLEFTMVTKHVDSAAAEAFLNHGNQKLRYINVKVAPARWTPIRRLNNQNIAVDNWSAIQPKISRPNNTYSTSILNKDLRGTQDV